MSLTMDFTDKTVVVVGGTSGINRGVAELFAAHGANVAVASRSQPKVDDTVEALKGYGVKAMGFSADVRDPVTLGEGLSEVHQAMGDFDVVVSGAAGNFPAMAKDLSERGFQSVVDIDLRGTFHVMKAIYPHLRRPGASVINISAPQAFLPMQAQVHVCAAKAGVDMITRTLAVEWGREGIRMNSVVPGPIEGTEGMDRLAPTEEAQQLVVKDVPLARMGTKADIGHLCMFLSSELGSYVSGTVIPCDGAWSQKGCGQMSDYLAMMVSK